MNGTEVEFPVGDGVLSRWDFGGRGEGVLLVHGSGHNAAAWTDVAAHLVAHCHPVGVDLRGHGQTAIDSSGPEQYWRDLSSVVTALSWDRPVLVGHSTGAYLPTRTFELVVHALDLVAALGLVGDPPQGAASQSLRIMADLAVAGGRAGPLLLAATGRTPPASGFSVL